MKSTHSSLINAPILGLSDKEKVVLSALSRIARQVLVSELSGLTHIPRTTLYPILDALHERRLLVLKKQKRLMHAEIVSVEKIRDSILESVGNEEVRKQNAPAGSGDQGETYKAKQGACSIRIEFGFEAMAKAYIELTFTGKDQRYCGIQSNAAMKEVLRRLTPSGIAYMCRRVKSQRMIIDGVLQDNSIGEWFKSMEELGIAETDRKLMAKEFAGRMADTHYVPNEFFHSKTEVWVVGDTVRFFDWDNGVFIEIVGKDTAALIKDLYTMSKTFGKKVDQNTMLAATWS